MNVLICKIAAPGFARSAALLHVDLDDGILLFALGGLVEDFALRTCHEAAPPELDTFCLAAGVGLETYTVDGDDGDAVSYRMAALNGDPSFPLALLLGWRV